LEFVIEPDAALIAVANTAVNSSFFIINRGLTKISNTVGEQGGSNRFAGAPLVGDLVVGERDGGHLLKLSKNWVVSDSHGISPIPARSLIRTGLTG
jgi:hypothetical protein